MKLFFRIFILANVFLLVGLVVAYIVLTRPAVQKKIVETQLPEGSSIGFVHLTKDRLNIEGLNIQLPDGTTTEVDALSSEFSVLAALRERTIRLRGLSVEGLRVRLPQVDTVREIASETEDVLAPDGLPAELDPSDHLGEATDADPARLPVDLLYQLGQIDWRVDIDSILLQGALIDGSGNRFSLNVESNAWAPGAETELTAKLKLESKSALQGGLSEFYSDLKLDLSQGAAGGFEELKLRSTTEGKDSEARSLLALSQDLELSAQSEERSARLDFSFSLAMPQPEIFVPQLSAIRELKLTGEGSAQAVGEALTLEAADLRVLSEDVERITLVLKQSLIVGGEQKFVGNLLEAGVNELPLTWIQPWLGSGFELSGAPFSAQFAVVGKPDGGMEIKAMAPVEWGPFSLAQSGRPLIDAITVRANPTIWFEEGGTIRYDLGELVLSNAKGRFLGGALSGVQVMDPVDGAMSTPRLNANLSLALAELFRQPALQGLTNIMTGQMDLRLQIDETQSYPFQLQAAIGDLRARELSMSNQDYRLAAQAREVMGGALDVGLKIEAGPENRPSTSLDLAGQIKTATKPLQFSAALTGKRLTQADLDLLLAVATPGELEPSADAPPVTPSSPPSPSRPPTSGQAASAIPPVWSQLDGDLTIDLGQLALNSGPSINNIKAKARISEPELSVSDISAEFNEGSLNGVMEITFDPSRDSFYALNSDLNFENIEPSYFSKGPPQSFPVKGLFDGRFNATGRGFSLEQAIENSEVDLLLEGRNGLFTAFQMNNVTQLGLIGAGLLGQGLQRPGISALAQSVPYFENIRFEEFVLELTRKQDRKVRIPRLLLNGDNIQIDGQGLIAASRLRDVLDQPMDLTLGLGAKGGLVDHLETLGLLKAKADPGGFRAWNQDIKIVGTLARPNTDSLKELLRGAAIRALNQSNDSTASPEGESQQPRQQSKEAKILEDVGRGFDVLNSFIN